MLYPLSAMPFVRIYSEHLPPLPHPYLTPHSNSLKHLPTQNKLLKFTSNIQSTIYILPHMSIHQSL